MNITLPASKVKNFLREMEKLENKFNYKYIDGELSNYVKLGMKNSRLICLLDKELPEMVRVACYMVFVETLL